MNKGNEFKGETVSVFSTVMLLSLNRSDVHLKRDYTDNRACEGLKYSEIFNESINDTSSLPSFGPLRPLNPEATS